MAESAWWTRICPSHLLSGTNEGTKFSKIYANARKMLITNENKRKYSN